MEEKIIQKIQKYIHLEKKQFDRLTCKNASKMTENKVNYDTHVHVDKYVDFVDKIKKA